MSKSPEAVRNLLHNVPGLRRLGKQIDEHRWLLAQLQQNMPSDLAGHCEAAVWSGDRLTLYASSSAWANRLRYATPQLRDWLAPRIPAIRKIRVRVLLLATGAAAKRDREAKMPAARRLSATNRRLLIEVAQGLGDDELGLALSRLARHGD